MTPFYTGRKSVYSSQLRVSFLAPLNHSHIPGIRPSTPCSGSLFSDLTLNLEMSPSVYIDSTSPITWEAAPPQTHTPVIPMTLVWYKPISLPVLDCSHSPLLGFCEKQKQGCPVLRNHLMVRSSCLSVTFDAKFKKKEKRSQLSHDTWPGMVRDGQPKLWSEAYLSVMVNHLYHSVY